MGAYRSLTLLLMSVVSASAIVELNDNNFFDYAKDKDVLLVDFYAPWCSDCQKLAPDFDNAGAILGARSGNLAKVDCFGAGKGLCQMYGVKSWPQLKNFNRGTYTGEYNGPQTGEAMASYVNMVANAAQSQPMAMGNPYAMNVAPYPVYAAPAKQALHFQSPFAPKLPVAAARPLPPLLVKSDACAKCDTPRYPGPAFRVPPAPVMVPCIGGRSCIVKSGKTAVANAPSKIEKQLGLKKSSTGEPKEAKAISDEGDHSVPHTGLLNITMKNVKKTDVKPLRPRDMLDDKRTLKSVLLGKAN